MKFKYILFIIGVLFLFDGCATKYYHANIKVTNSFGAKVYYKVYQMNELSDPNSTSGNLIVDVIPPIHSPMDAGITDTLDINWGGSYSYTRIKVSFGDTVDPKGAYLYGPSSYQIIDDGATKNVTLGVGGTITIN
jgi:hypothetical protein